MADRSLRFRREEVQNIYFKNKLCDEFKNSRFAMPEKIRKGRNVAIILAAFEIASCLASLAFYIRRRSRIILVLIIMNFLATFLGIKAKLSLSYCGLLSHAVYTISVIGGFYIYIFIDYFVTGGDKSENAGDPNKVG